MPSDEVQNKKKKTSVKKVKDETQVSESVSTTVETSTPVVETSTPVVAPVKAASVKAASVKVAPVKAAPVQASAPVSVTSESEDLSSSSAVNTDTTTAASPEETSTTEILFNKLVSQFTDLQTVMKTIHLNMKVLQKEVLRERKEYKKKESKIKKKSDKKKNVSGFEKPTSISNELSVFLNLVEGQQVSRREVTNKLIAYVKEHNLQNPADKRKILPDEKLTKILQQVDDVPITFFNLQTYLKKHFLPTTPAVTADATTTTSTVV